MKTANLTAAIATIVAGMLAAGSAQAQPYASGESLVSISNFTISDAAVGGAQLNAATDFTTLSATSTETNTTTLLGGLSGGVQSLNLNNATDPGSSGATSSSGAALVSGQVTTVNGAAVPAGISGPVLGAAYGASTSYNAVSLPFLTGAGTGFGATGSNELGSPVTNFGPIGTPTTASINNASYSGLDTLKGTISSTSTSNLSSDFKFVTGKDFASGLAFSFNYGTYLATYLTNGAAQSASASFEITFTLKHKDATTGLTVIDLLSSIGDNISSNAPGQGLTLGSLNDVLASAAGTPLTTPHSQTFISAPLLAGIQYTLTADIKNTTAVTLNVPEPGILGLLGIGLLGLGVSSRKFSQSGMTFA